MNWRKSKLYQVDDVVQNIQVLAAILGCEVGLLPSTYLDLPLGSKNKAQGIWSGVIKRCEKRLATWKRQYLS